MKNVRIKLWRTKTKKKPWWKLKVPNWQKKVSAQASANVHDSDSDISSTSFKSCNITRGGRRTRNLKRRKRKKKRKESVKIPNVIVLIPVLLVFLFFYYSILFCSSFFYYFLTYYTRSTPFENTHLDLIMDLLHCIYFCILLIVLNYPEFICLSVSSSRHTIKWTTNYIGTELIRYARGRWFSSENSWVTQKLDHIRWQLSKCLLLLSRDISQWTYWTTFTVSRCSWKKMVVDRFLFKICVNSPLV